MKKKASLTSQSCHWWITIRKNIEIDINNIKQWCDSLSLGDMYAFIEHKGDISADSGEVEGVHYHIVINSGKRHQKANILNSIVKYFGLDNPFGIEVDIYSSFEGCLQYLTHQNEPKKTRHDRKEIIYNFDSDLFATMLDTTLTTELTATSLQAYILEADNPMDLAVKIGLGTYTHYQSVIRQFWRYLKREDI